MSLPEWDVRNIRPLGLCCTECTYGERRGAYRFVVGKPEGKRLLGRAKHAGEDNIKMFYPDSFTSFSFHFIHLFVNMRSHLCITYSLCLIRIRFLSAFCTTGRWLCRESTMFSIIYCDNNSIRKL